MCDSCGVQPASVHVARVEDGHITTSNLCQSCAQALGEEMGGNALVFAIPSAVSRLFGAYLGAEADDSLEGEELPDLICSVCGTMLSDVGESGFLGCPSCYGAFEGFAGVEPEETVSEYQGKVPGRDPNGGSGRREVLRLRRMLRELVESERYEEAASVRDKLTELGELPQS